MCVQTLGFSISRLHHHIGQVAVPTSLIAGHVLPSPVVVALVGLPAPVVVALNGLPAPVVVALVA